MPRLSATSLIVPDALIRPICDGDVGIEILTVEARVVIACVDTFLHYAEEITKVEQASIAVPASA